jgi:hypothetical protein
MRSSSSAQVRKCWIAYVAPPRGRPAVAFLGCTTGAIFYGVDLVGGAIVLSIEEMAERTKRFVSRVRMRLEKLRVRGVVVRENRGRAHREFTYKLLRPDLAAKALAEKGGGLARAAKVRSEPSPPAQSEMLSALIAGAAHNQRRASLKRGGDHSRSRRKQEEG